MVWYQLFFSLTGYLTKTKESSLPYYLLVAEGEGINSCLSPKIISTKSISSNNNHYVKCTSEIVLYTFVFFGFFFLGVLGRGLTPCWLVCACMCIALSIKVINCLVLCLMSSKMLNCGSWKNTTLYKYTCVSCKKMLT